MWGRESALFLLWHSVAAFDERCDPISISFYPGVRAYTQCLRPYPDKLSDRVRQEGHWLDCDDLPRLWKSVSSSKGGLFVDVGANIGSCTLVMLAHGVPTVAFEPLPANRFYLTQSVRKNEAHFTGLLSLHPVALGSKSGIVPLFTSPGNAGNTVLERSIGDDANDARRMRRQAARVKTLDHVLWPGGLRSAPPPIIPLMKLDAQGYEEQVLRGAPRLLGARAIRTIKMELAPHWLHLQNSSVMRIYDLLTRYGFVLTTIPFGDRVSKATLVELDSQSSPLAIVDIVATLA